jgi:tRNA(fMet)-specific endonuclease VapC
MSALVLDTDVTSFMFKKDTRARKYRRHLHGQIGIVSFMTLAELDHWALRRRWGQKRRDELSRFLAAFEIHYPDRALCALWAEITDTTQRLGRPVKVADAWIAAAALQLGVSLVTNNPADFAGVPGLKVLTEADT